MAASLSIQDSGESYKDCLGPKKRYSMNPSLKELSGPEEQHKVCRESETTEQWAGVGPAPGTLCQQGG